MADIFANALADLKDALTAGEGVDAAIQAVAADYSLKPEALRNRAAKAWGDLTSYGAKNHERELEAVARDNEADAIALARSATAKPQREWKHWTIDERKAFSKAIRLDRYWKRK